MMNLKHLLAGTVVTAAVTATLVLGGAVSAQASIFPPPTPIGPGDVTKPIYTQPNLPGFHLPKELWTWYGPLFKPSALPPYTHVLDCAHVFSDLANSALVGEGYVLSSDHAIHATTDPQLLALLNAGTSNSCRWVQSKTGAIVDTTTAINVNDGTFASRLRSTGFAEPGPTQGFHRLDADGRTETVDVANYQGGIDYITFDWNRTDLTYLFQDINTTFWNANH